MYPEGTNQEAMAEIRGSCMHWVVMRGRAKSAKLTVLSRWELFSIIAASAGRMDAVAHGADLGSLMAFTYLDRWSTGTRRSNGFSTGRADGRRRSRMYWKVT